VKRSKVTNSFRIGWFITFKSLVRAADKVSDGLKAAIPKFHGQSSKAMRNVLVHFYFGVKLDTVWKTIVRGLCQY